MLAADPDRPPSRNDRRPCRWCGGSAAGCRSLEWLRGQRCCSRCGGNHDADETGTEHERTTT